MKKSWKRNSVLVFHCSKKIPVKDSLKERFIVVHGCRGFSPQQADWLLFIRRACRRSATHHLVARIQKVREPEKTKWEQMWFPTLLLHNPIPFNLVSSHFHNFLIMPSNWVNLLMKLSPHVPITSLSSTPKSTTLGIIPSIREFLEDTLYLNYSIYHLTNTHLP